MTCSGASHANERDAQSQNGPGLQNHKFIPKGVRTREKAAPVNGFSDAILAGYDRNHKKVSEGGSTLEESGLLTHISWRFQPNFTKGERTP